MRGIMFKDWGVRAIRNVEPETWPPRPINPEFCIKWQTRRIVKGMKEPNPGSGWTHLRYFEDIDRWCWSQRKFASPGGTRTCWMRAPETSEYRYLKCPYSVGETLYVKETLCRVSLWVHYQADYKIVAESMQWRWKRDTLPAMFMPRDCAREFVKIKGIRVERVQEITPKDACAEGVHVQTRYSVRSFKDEWNAINGPQSWDENPWVFMFEFIRIAQGEG